MYHWFVPKPITILLSGTRGDIQPYIALGLAMRENGCAVRIATHLQFKVLVEQYGFDFVPLSASPNELFFRQKTMPLTFNQGFWRGLQASLAYWRAARPVFTALLESAWQACQGSAGLIVGLPTTWGQNIADALGVPCAWCPLQPLAPTSSFPSVFLPWRKTPGAWYNWLSHRLMEQATWQPWRMEFNHWRRSLGLPRLPIGGPFKAWEERQIPHIYGISSYVLTSPPDWPACYSLAGYWFLERLPEWQPPLDLLRFLEAGEPPLYAGFGSMRQSSKLASMLVQAARLSGRRIIAALSGMEGAQANLPPNLMLVKDIPHDWLFPQMSGALHHGGAGTTAASLRAGLPTAIAPVGVDQFFWGERVQSLGVGPQPISQNRLTVDSLAALFDELSRNGQCRQRARSLGALIDAEQGENKAANLLAKVF